MRLCETGVRELLHSVVSCLTTSQWSVFLWSVLEVSISVLTLFGCITGMVFVL